MLEEIGRIVNAARAGMVSGDHDLIRNPAEPFGLKWGLRGRPALVALTACGDQRLAPGTQSTSARPLSLATRAATKSQSDSRLR